MDNISVEQGTLKEEFGEVWHQLTLKNMSLYMLGMIFIGFGVSLMIRSYVGVSSWDTLHYSLDQLIPWLTFGMANALVASTTTLVIVYMNRNWKYIVMLLPVYIVALFIDVFDKIIFVDLIYSQAWHHLLGYFIGLSVLPLGGSLMIISKLPAGVYDEFMIAILRKLKSTKIPLVRGTIEVTVVLAALVIGYFAGAGIGKLSYGTVLFSISFGFYLKFYLSIFERIGLYEIKQTY